MGRYGLEGKLRNYIENRPKAGLLARIGASAIMLVAPYMPNFNSKAAASQLSVIPVVQAIPAYQMAVSNDLGSSSNPSEVIIKIAEELAEGCVTHSISSSIGGDSFTTCYSKDGKPGPEDDHQFFPIPYPGSYTTMTTSVDGVEVSGITEPASSSPGSGNCPSVTYHVGIGETLVVPPGTKWYADASASFNGWKSKVTPAEGEISPGTYVGPTSFSFGGSASIEFWKTGSNPDNPDGPGTTTPGITIPTKPVYIPPVNLDLKRGIENPAIIGGWRNFPLDKTLFIDNLWEGCNRNSNVYGWALTLMSGDDEYFNGNDLRYEKLSDDLINSMVTSTLVRKNGTTLNGLIDARATLPEKLIISAAFDSANGSPIVFNSPTRNHLSFSYPALYGNNTNIKRPFDEKIVSIGYNGIDAPRWDVHKLITINNGVFELLPLNGSYPAKVSYVDLVIYGGYELTDINLDKSTNSVDYNLAVAKLGFKGVSSCDIGGILGLGMPDGIVDSNDVNFIYKALLPEEQKKVIPPDQLVMPSGKVGMSFKSGFVPSFAREQVASLFVESELKNPTYKNDGSIVRV